MSQKEIRYFVTEYEPTMETQLGKPYCVWQETVWSHGARGIRLIDCFRTYEAALNKAEELNLLNEC